MLRICFICSGNICRSPSAEVVFNRLAEARGLDVVADSAGTGAWHAGDDMDARSRETLVAAGFRPGGHVAKQFTAAMFAERDLVVALDRGHESVLRHLAGETDDPARSRAKIVLLRRYDPVSRLHGRDLDVADPYYGGDRGFTEVLEQIERSCAGLLDELTRTTAEPRSDVS